MDVIEGLSMDGRALATGGRFSRFTVALVITGLLGGCASISSVSNDVSSHRADRKKAAAEASRPAEPPIESAEDARERAAKALLEQDSDLALYYYLEAVKLDPQDSESFYNIAVLNEKKGNKELAARAYARVVEIDPENALALQALGIAYFESREPDSAETLLERAVAADPDLWQAHNVLGVIADTRGDYATAAEHYSAALALRPDSASILNNRGYSKYLAGDLEAAEKDFHAAIASDASYERAWHNLGLVFARQHKYGFALRAMSKVMSEYVAANDVGYIAMLDGDYDAAETLFAEAIRLSPRYYKTAEDNAAELRRRRTAQAPTEPIADANTGG